MKNFIIHLIKILFSLIISTALCNTLYSWNHLDKVFGPKITFEQWCAIICIIQIFLPSTKLINHKKEKNDE